LGERVDAYQREIAHYEQDSAQPSGALLVELARALKVTGDELLGLKPSNRQPRRKQRGS